MSAKKVTKTTQRKAAHGGCSASTPAWGTCVWCGQPSTTLERQCSAPDGDGHLFKAEQSSVISKEDARTILGMEEICQGEGIGPRSEKLIGSIFEQHPTLRVDFSWIEGSNVAPDPSEPLADLKLALMRVSNAVREVEDIFDKEIQSIADRHGVVIATGHMSDVWQVKKPGAVKWLSEFHDKHPALDDLRALEKCAMEARVGPTSNMFFRPSGTRSKKSLQKSGTKQTAARAPKK